MKIKIKNYNNRKIFNHFFFCFGMWKKKEWKGKKNILTIKNIYDGGDGDGDDENEYNGIIWQKTTKKHSIVESMDIHWIVYGVGVCFGRSILSYQKNTSNNVV